MLNPVLFPPHISSGMEGGPRFKTTIAGTHKGDEQRNIDWESARGEWTFDRRNLTAADLAELDRFFLAHHGQGYSFLFKDWADYKARMAVSDSLPFLLTTTGGNLPPVQLIKRYGVGRLEYTREIARPAAGTIVLYADGTVIDPSNYTLDISNGLLTWNPAYMPAPGVEITWDGEFTIPVRFNTDYQKRRYERGPRYQWNQIEIIEVRNEPDVS
jgi:uncharacterized protein (TIGR02217 family)